MSIFTDMLKWKSARLKAGGSVKPEEFSIPGYEATNINVVLPICVPTISSSPVWQHIADFTPQVRGDYVVQTWNTTPYSTSGNIYIEIRKEDGTIVASQEVSQSHNPTLLCENLSSFIKYNIYLKNDTGAQLKFNDWIIRATVIISNLFVQAEVRYE